MALVWRLSVLTCGGVALRQQARGKSNGSLKRVVSILFILSPSLCQAVLRSTHAITTERPNNPSYESKKSK